MPSAEPSQRKAYANDLRWCMVYQPIGMHLTIERIAENLNVSASTVCSVMERFNRSGVDPEDPHKRRPDLRRFDERSEIYMVGLLLQNPTMCLGEVCHEIYEVFGLEVSPSTICRLLLSYGITQTSGARGAATMRLAERCIHGSVIHVLY